MLTFIPNKAPGGIPPSSVGQVTITSSMQYTVPEGVTNLCAVCVGTGGKHNRGANNRDGGGGGGGGLAWGNNLPVKPGDVLDIVIGRAVDVVAVTTAVSLVVTSISLNGVVLLSAMSGRNGRVGSLASGAGPGGNGGTFTIHPSITDAGGGIGGQGGNGGTSTSGNSPSCGAGGGAAGYTGNGGRGGQGGTGNTNSSGSGGVGSGGGGGGGRPSSGSSSNTPGGGVGLQGQGANGAAQTTDSRAGNPGSLPAPVFGGGSGGGVAQEGAVRLIWGNFRAFPSTNTADM